MNLYYLAFNLALIISPTRDISAFPANFGLSSPMTFPIPLMSTAPVDAEVFVSCGWDPIDRSMAAVVEWGLGAAPAVQSESHRDAAPARGCGCRRRRQCDASVWLRVRSMVLAWVLDRVALGGVCLVSDIASPQQRRLVVSHVLSHANLLRVQPRRPVRARRLRHHHQLPRCGMGCQRLRLQLERQLL